MEIIPAIMPKDFEEITAKAELIHAFIKTVQIDVMDGELTHSRSWPYFPGQEESFEKVASGEIGLPYWKDIDYEADLMVKNPEEDFGSFVNAGFHRIIVHVESTLKFRDIMEEWKGVVEIGAAINIDTENDVLFPLIEDGVNFIQFMGIATIGYQGSPFDSRVIQKIESLRKAYPEVIISVDGGVNLETAPLLLKAGANRLVAGSAIFGSESIEMTVDEFKKLETKTI
jgi:ribulose-phosphate 3-epimerase